MRKILSDQTEILCDYIGKHPAVGTNELIERFALQFNVTTHCIRQRLNKLKDDGVVKNKRCGKHGGEAKWSLVKARRSATSSSKSDEYGWGKREAREKLRQVLSGMESIGRFATLPGRTILSDDALEKWILSRFPDSYGDGAERDTRLFRRIDKKLDDNTRDNYRLHHAEFGDMLRRLPEDVVLDFVFADFCGGVGPANMDTVEEAFRRSRKGSVIAVTSTTGLRQKGKPGSYFAEYGHCRNNRLCLLMELVKRAESMGCDVSFEAQEYTGKKQTMLLYIFTVR
jgi:hypothetical protein